MEEKIYGSRLKCIVNIRTGIDKISCTYKLKQLNQSMNFSFFRIIFSYHDRLLRGSLLLKFESFCVCVCAGGMKSKSIYIHLLFIIYFVPLKHLRFQMKEMDASFIHIIRCTWVSSHAISCLIFVIFQFVNLWFVWEKLCFDKRKNLMCFPISNYIGW